MWFHCSRSAGGRRLRRAAGFLLARCSPAHLPCAPLSAQIQLQSLGERSADDGEAEGVDEDLALVVDLSGRLWGSRSRVLRRPPVVAIVHEGVDVRHGVNQVKLAGQVVCHELTVGKALLDGADR